MANAVGSRHSLSYVAESAFGVTPGSPSMLGLRSTGTTLNPAKTSGVSTPVGSRQVVAANHDLAKPSGDITAELSYAAFDDMLEAGLFGAWASNVLKVGSALTTFTVERRFTDIDRYLVFTGATVDTFKLKAGPAGAVKVTFGLICAGQFQSGSSLGSPADPASFEPFNGLVGSILEGGSPIGTVTGVELSLRNSASRQIAVGSSVATGMSYGTSTLVGTVNTRFASGAHLAKFLDETESDLEFTITDPVGNDLTFEVPRIKYSGAALPVSKDGPITLKLPFQAILDAGEATNFMITRTPA